ncbi:BTB/POZ domain-containing protein [Carex littledalei]|uniref:BTB/POZ domain-containing protein n=1 Tax=Carex littledalei TaxID=544730 RepID=A0A833RIH3_9POAL|nr:BTB/POZ domain-containing protein [Carex littledalei]
MAAHHRRRASTWCCSFSPPPASPDRKIPVKSPAHSTNLNPSPSPNPNPNPRPFLSRRILSPGRVSPIDSDQMATDLVAVVVDSTSTPACIEESSLLVSEEEVCADFKFEVKGKDGRGVLVELMDRGVLCENSVFFKGLIENDTTAIEVDNVDLFKDAIELIEFSEKDFMRSIVKNGVSHAIDLLEVMCTIKYERGITSCLKYIEAAPWTENEEEKLKILFSKIKLEQPIVDDIVLRLNQKPDFASSAEGDLAVNLIRQIANSSNSIARKDMQSLVNSILCESSVYQKDHTRINRDSLYQLCNSCLNSLKDLFKEEISVSTKPLIERVSTQVENLTWLFEILLKNNMAEEFVDLWGNQEELVKSHERYSPMVRYELSRVSVCVFIALGKGKLQCKGNARLRVFNTWFRPILLDFGWLKRCPKGLDFRMFEETLGKALLTLPLVQQQRLFEEWFNFFSVKGTECPNLSTAFQVWWRRSFVRSVSMQVGD